MAAPDAAAPAGASPETQLWIGEFLLAHPECAAIDAGLAGPLIDLAYRPLFGRRRGGGPETESCSCAALGGLLGSLAPDINSAQFFVWFLQIHLEDYAAMPVTEAAAREILAAAEQNLFDRAHPKTQAAPGRKHSV